jgi:hypothetical protein
MRAVSRVLALAVALGAAAFLVDGSEAQSAKVEHAAIPHGQYVVEVWRDPVDGELTFRTGGSHDRAILRRLTLYHLIEGRLSSVVVFSAAAHAWRPIRLQYGLTPERVDAALAAGDRVDRPALMDVPSLDRSTRQYFFAKDFGTDVRALRRAAGFPVPSPGLMLGGLRLADVFLGQSRGPRRLVDGGYVATLTYSATPDRLGTGERQLGVYAAPPGTSAADSYRMFFRSSRQRLVGPGYEALLTPDGQAILRYRGMYVLVFPQFDLPLTELRAALSRVANS